MKTAISLALAISATTALATSLAPRATLPRVTVRGNGMSIATSSSINTLTDFL